MWIGTNGVAWLVDKKVKEVKKQNPPAATAKPKGKYYKFLVFDCYVNVAGLGSLTTALSILSK